MAQRQELQDKLVEILESGNVYFQPDSNIKMEYPAIVYARDYSSSQFADNELYRHHKRYQVTVISRSPDSPIPDKVLRLPFCTFRRFFIKDGLNHDVFDLFY